MEAERARYRPSAFPAKIRRSAGKENVFTYFRKQAEEASADIPPYCNREIAGSRNVTESTPV